MAVMVAVVRNDGARTVREIWEVEPTDEVRSVYFTLGERVVEMREMDGQILVTSHHDLLLEPRSPNLVGIRLDGAEG